MKKQIALAIGMLAAGSIFAADSSATNQVGNAITKLKELPNYSWTTKLELPGMPFSPGPLKGQTEKGGVALVTQEFNENTIQAAFKGDKIAVKTDGEWQLVDAAQGRGTRMAGMLARSGTPADEAESLLKKVKELKAGEGGLFSGDLTAEGAKDLLSFGPRGGQGGPAPKNPKGSVKFWLKDGALNKFESRVQGTIAFGQDQEERELDMTRTVEIQDVGKTKVDVPDETKKKLAAR